MAKGVAVVRPVRSLSERRSLRERMGSLRSLRIAPATAARYQTALTLFFRWLQIAHPERFSSIVNLSEAVCEFLEMLWEERAAKGRAGDTLSALQWQLLALIQ
eukprot:5634794-Amphidinium_carterae.2